ncbi:hypothetical protein KAJ27_02035 [bacterium]|nr:hypothetical protein [bacterium]
MLHSYESLESIICDEQAPLSEKVEAILKLSINTDSKSQDLLDSLLQHEDERIIFFVIKIMEKELVWKINLLVEGCESIMHFFYYRDIVEVKTLIDTMEVSNNELPIINMEELNKVCQSPVAEIEYEDEKSFSLTTILGITILSAVIFIFAYSELTSGLKEIKSGNIDNSISQSKEITNKVLLKKIPESIVVENKKAAVKPKKIHDAIIVYSQIKDIFLKNFDFKKTGFLLNSKDVNKSESKKSVPRNIASIIETDSEKIIDKITDLVNNKKYDKAIDELKKIARTNPYEPAPYLEMGDIFIRISKPMEGVKAYEEALKRKPDMNDLRALLARSYESIGDFPKSIKHYSLLTVYETDIKLKNMFKEKLFELSQKGK